MQKWEYKMDQVFLKTKEAGLNALGAQGWELVAVIPDSLTIIAYFKRPIPEEPKTVNVETTEFKM